MTETVAVTDVAQQAAGSTGRAIITARITQILDLTLLAPDIQEEVLFMETNRERDPVNEHTLRWVLCGGAWEEQRRRWNELRQADTQGTGP
jgi:hypothetical protein